ncbi:MAG: response regulator [Methylorubrum populi]
MDQPAPPDPRSDARPDRRSDERLLALVVESETVLRIETADLLAEAGFEVLEAWSAPTAIRQIERYGDIRLVVVDADLPEGRFALARDVAAGWPDRAVVVLSAGPPPAPGELPDGVRFGPKPLTAALARAARERLAG